MLCTPFSDGKITFFVFVPVLLLLVLVLVLVVVFVVVVVVGIKYWLYFSGVSLYVVSQYPLMIQLNTNCFVARINLDT